MTQVNISEKVQIKIVSGVSQKTQKEWEAISIKIGDWSTLVFPKTKFELDYIKKQIEE